MTTLKAENLSLAYSGHPVVQDLTLDLPAGQITMVIGANGSGKSTLLRGLAGRLAPAAGAVLLDGTDLHDRPADEVARALGLLPEPLDAAGGTTVRELVARGRAPEGGAGAGWTQDDDDAVDRALAATHCTDLAARDAGTLSGGQRQRAWMASVLARESGVLLLDEPTTHLDLAHQLVLLDAIADLNRRHGTTVAMVLHDLNLAARYADHLVALADGAIVASGRPSEVLTAEFIQAVFGLPARVIPDPVAGSPLVLPIGRHRVLRPEVADDGGAPRFRTSRLEDESPVAGQDASGRDAPAQEPAAGQEGGDSAVVPVLRKPAVEVCPTLAFSLTAVDVQDLGPSFRRLTLAGPELEHFGTGGHPLDLRIKVLVPPAGDGAVERMRDLFADLAPGGTISDEDASGWYRTWLAKDPAERGAMRTYTVRSFRPAGHPGNAGADPELDLDFVLHVRRENGVLVGGPASVWAAEAQVGDEVVILGPNRALCGHDYGGIEFRPGQARRILLAGDETAAPAICSILESLPPGITGDAFIEVPSVDDIQGSFTRSGVAVQWLPRGMQAPGNLLEAAVRSAVAVPGAGAVDPGNDYEDVNVDEGILWETTSGSGQPFYAWIAGEAGVIKSMRRYLVRDVGIDRKQVSFMGYWRTGRAEG
ncbi:SIP domain-containing protein [Arthrobacter sp. JSM 101049]|uniref:SIP domain-containing protein n=1 Tax=Arthrobacter sp. JSM 101049 TaxID=929097 RepID=UPI00356B2A79